MPIRSHPHTLHEIRTQRSQHMTDVGAIFEARRGRLLYLKYPSLLFILKVQNSWTPMWIQNCLFSSGNMYVSWNFQANMIHIYIYIYYTRWVWGMHSPNLASGLHQKCSESIWYFCIMIIYINIYMWIIKQVHYDKSYAKVHTNRHPLPLPALLEGQRGRQWCCHPLRMGHTHHP